MALEKRPPLDQFCRRMALERHRLPQFCLRVALERHRIAQFCLRRALERHRLARYGITSLRALEGHCRAFLMGIGWALVGIGGHWWALVGIDTGIVSKGEAR